MAPFDQTARLHTVHQPNGTMRPNLQPVSQVGNAGGSVWSQTAQHEQQLIVPRFESGRLGRALAECEVAPQETSSQSEICIVLIAEIRRAPLI